MAHDVTSRAGPLAPNPHTLGRVEQRLREARRLIADLGVPSWLATADGQRQLVALRAHLRALGRLAELLEVPDVEEVSTCGRCGGEYPGTDCPRCHPGDEVSGVRPDDCPTGLWERVSHAADLVLDVNTAAAVVTTEAGDPVALERVFEATAANIRLLVRMVRVVGGYVVVRRPGVYEVYGAEHNLVFTRTDHDGARRCDCDGCIRKDPSRSRKSA